MRSYCTSKLMLIMWTEQLHKELFGTGIDVFAVHPGGCLPAASTHTRGGLQHRTSRICARIVPHDRGGDDGAVRPSIVTATILHETHQATSGQ
jgi:NAD(P)-dependent dehydrogenase (short-subunit alcohol dehydrogenase family)